MNISVVVPVLNEQDNVIPLHKEIFDVLKNIKGKHEIIFVDDGSWDKTEQKLLTIKDKQLIVVQLRDNFGQSAALDAGLKQASGDIIITMDGDGQNDPKDIPRLIKKLHQGYDVVSGWRKHRKDKITKHITSRLAYLIRKKVTKLDIHDNGCTLKAYTKESVQDLNLSGEMHRFIPNLIAFRGFKIGELIVNHRSRTAGKTKYSTTRVIKGLLDLLVVLFWQKFAKRPMHFFGGFGLLLIVIGGLIDIYLIFNRLAFGYSLSDRPLFLLANLTLIMGLQLLMIGLLADIGLKNYYAIKQQHPYSIKQIHKK